MLRSGFGAKGAKSISSMQGGRNTSVDASGGPDKVIRTFGSTDIKGWFDSTDIRLSEIANNSDVSTWHDKGPDGQNVVQSTADEKPHYIHSGLNGRPVLRSDGTDDVMLSTGEVDWASVTSVFVLFKKGDDDSNRGPFASEVTSAAATPRAFFGIAALTSAGTSKLRAEVFGRTSDNFSINNLLNTSGDASDIPPTITNVRDAYMLSYHEWQINSGVAGDGAFTIKSYNKEAVSEVSVSSTDHDASDVLASDATTMASDGFDTTNIQLFKNIHNPGFLNGDIAFALFSNRHYNLKERQKILKAIQQRFGNSNIN